MRGTVDAVGDADSLWLDYEPSKEEVLESIAAQDLKNYSELVFCGFGEPMMRADDLFWVAKQTIQAIPGLPIRINTNGHGNIIAGRDITPDMAGIIDRLSISLNRADKTAYNRHVRPVFGVAAFDGLLDFVEKARKHVPEITLTVVDLLLPDELARCREIADRFGVAFRVRATR